MAPLARIVTAFGLATWLLLPALELDLLPADVLLPPVNIAENLGSNEEVVITGQAVQRALRVVSTGPFSSEYSYSSAIPLSQDIRSGDQVTVRFWAHSGNARPARVLACIQMNKAPYDKPLAETVVLGGFWEERVVTAVAKRHFPAKTTEIRFFFGFPKQIAEIGPVRVTITRPDGSTPAPSQAPVGAELFFLKDQLLPERKSMKDGSLSQVCAVTGQAFSQALRIKSVGPFTNKWDFTLVRKPTQDLKTGDQISFSFRARSTGGSPASFLAYVGSKKPPYYKPAQGTLNITTTWQDYSVSGTLKEDLPASAMEVGGFFGFPNQTLELGPVTLKVVRR
jgi:hypothetical protein